MFYILELIAAFYEYLSHETSKRQYCNVNLFRMANLQKRIAICHQIHCCNGKICKMLTMTRNICRAAFVSKRLMRGCTSFWKCHNIAYMTNALEIFLWLVLYLVHMFAKFHCLSLTRSCIFDSYKSEGGRL